MKNENLDPRIGKLSSGTFYTHVNGPEHDPVFGTLAEIEFVLGLRESSETAEVRDEPYEYAVTITTSERVDELVIEAQTREEAIKKARAWYRDEYGPARETLPAKYRARLILFENWLP